MSWYNVNAIAVSISIESNNPATCKTFLSHACRRFSSRAQITKLLISSRARTGKHTSNRRDHRTNCKKKKWSETRIQLPINAKLFHTSRGKTSCYTLTRKSTISFGKHSRPYCAEVCPSVELHAQRSFFHVRFQYRFGFSVPIFYRALHKNCIRKFRLNCIRIHVHRTYGIHGFDQRKYLPY